MSHIPTAGIYYTRLLRYRWLSEETAERWIAMALRQGGVVAAREAYDECVRVTRTDRDIQTMVAMAIEYIPARYRVRCIAEARADGLLPGVTAFDE